MQFLYNGALITTSMSTKRYFRGMSAILDQFKYNLLRNRGIVEGIEEKVFISTKIYF